MICVGIARGRHRHVIAEHRFLAENGVKLEIVGGSVTVAFASMFPTRTITALPVETPCRNGDEWAAGWHHVEGNFGLPIQNTAQIKERVAVVDAALEQRWNIDRIMLRVCTGPRQASYRKRTLPHALGSQFPL